MKEEEDKIPPGFLKSQLGDHKSVVPAEAWANLEKKLAAKRKKMYNHLVVVAP